jgi:penicillin amidase
MSVFVRKDPRLLACADPPWPAAVLAMLRRHASVAAALCLIAAAGYAANVAGGLHVAAQDAGTVGALPLESTATIARDARGIPHIRAHTLHDLFFAQGFAEASDRLFEMDVTRRYAYGTLAEIFGARALSIDEDMRAADIGGIAARMWRGSDPQTRRILQAFSDGINAAEQRQPLPVEFRMLLYRPHAWAPQDSIAVSLVAALELGDSWRGVLGRDYRWRTLTHACYDAAFPLSDPRYDVTPDGRVLRAASASPGAHACDGAVLAAAPARTRAGSNAWAAGAQRTGTHRALIANDPHVDLTIPGIWYAVDLQAPGMHVAGTVIPGLPGVALGHNERLAWAVTNADVATSVVYRTTSPPAHARVVERFNVRFGAPISKAYYRTRDAFSIAVEDEQSVYMVRWPPFRQTVSTIPALIALDRAPSIPSALHVLAQYRGSPQNFILADTTGAITYHLAGALYDDPAWGRYVHPAADLQKPLRLLSFADLPAHAPGRASVLLSANNRMYGAGYPYRLSAAFEPPYRAYRIAQLLRARRTYDVAYFARMQMDTCSAVDAEIARAVLHARWNGCFEPSSKTASLAHRIRDELLEQNTTLALLLAQVRDGSVEAPLGSLSETTPKAWADAGRVDVDHPLSPAWYGLLRGLPLPGDGDEYTIHLQQPGFAQGFRAVWDVGNWDAGGIVLPSGESGEPGSGHYDDLAKTWIRGGLIPLAFSQRAVQRATVKTLLLTKANL